MRFTKKRITAVAVSTAVVALGAGGAFAYWTSTGSGSGSGSTGTATNFVVASSAATGDPLTPGGPTQTVAFTVTNPGSGSQNLSSVVVTVATSTGGVWTSGTCSAADYTVSTPAITYGQIAPGGTATGTVTLTMNNLATNQDACKGVTVPLYFAAS